jgi:hypothetical protein
MNKLNNNNNRINKKNIILLKINPVKRDNADLKNNYIPFIGSSKD